MEPVNFYKNGYDRKDLTRKEPCMEIRPITDPADWNAIRSLYRTAFPLCERKPFFLIRHIHRKGTADVWVIRENDTFAGFAVTLNAGNMVLLDYYAIVPEFRCSGIGTWALSQLTEHYRARRFFLEVESVYEPAQNLEERIRRKAFYLRAGLKPMHIMVDVFGTNMELLGFECSISYEEYLSVYRENFGISAVKHLKLQPYPKESEKGDVHEFD